MKSNVIWIVGGIAALGVVVLLVSRQQTAQQTALNEPGLVQAPVDSSGGISQIFSGVLNNGGLSTLTDAFSAGDTGSNDPGLEGDSYGGDYTD